MADLNQVQALRTALRKRYKGRQTVKSKVTLHYKENIDREYGLNHRSDCVRIVYSPLLYSSLIYLVYFTLRTNADINPCESDFCTHKLRRHATHKYPRNAKRTLYGLTGTSKRSSLRTVQGGTQQAVLGIRNQRYV